MDATPPADARWRALIRAVPDFPQPGVLFRDITPLLHDPAALRSANDALAAQVATFGATVVAGIEARGFIFGVAVAERLRLPFIPVRKPGKLPTAAASVSYALEYGSGALEAHLDPSIAGERAVIIDDVLATGGTAAAAAQLLEQLGATCAGYGFLLELTALGGRARLGDPPIAALLQY